MKVTRFKLGNRGITNLTPLAGLTELEALGLAGNSITDLTPLARLKELKALNLSYNRIVDLTPLAGLNGLQELDLRFNSNLTQAEIDKLQHALPKCRIFQNAGSSPPPSGHLISLPHPFTLAA